MTTWGLRTQTIAMSVLPLAFGCNAGDGGHGFDESAGASAAERGDDASSGVGSAGDAEQGDAEQGDAEASAETTAGADTGPHTPKLDVGGADSGGGCVDEGGGGGGLEEIAFSNIWIANSPQGTVSKIDTVTGTEIGRYRTGPNNSTDPSRTSVNLLGDAAVLNRGNGGAVVKIVAEESRCVDNDGDGTITTSTGPQNLLAWGSDECVLWSFALHAGARALAWDSGNDPSQEDCAGSPSVWAAAMDAAMTIHVYRLDGDTGAVLDETSLPNWDGSAEWGGLYGGAVDKGRNLWSIGKDNAALFRVDFATMEITRWEGPAGVERFYGLAMDKDGTPHVTAEFDNRLLQFDVDTETWLDIAMIPGTLRGLAIDENGDAWVATNGTCGLQHYSKGDGSVELVALPECNIPVGVSIDVDGFVWVVDQWAGAPPFGRAHKISRESLAIQLTVMGLDTPYTYSDMTGAGLDLVSFPPQG